MVHTLLDTVTPAVMDRLTLLINHVIGREPMAMQRLRPHAGALLRVELQGWPGWLPPVPVLRFRVSPAGLMEWVGGVGASGQGPELPTDDALMVRVDASRPDQIALSVLQGRRPQVQVEGDAALAAEVSWLAEHLRWDIADDLQRLVGPAVAQVLVSAGRAAADALSRLAARVPAPAAGFPPASAS